MSHEEDRQQATPTQPRSPARIDGRTLRRLMRGAYGHGGRDCGPPTRSPSGEWMERIAFDLPEAMLDALVERAGGENGARISEVIRAALASAGIGDPSHVPGICDGTHSDDAERAATEAEWDALRARVRADVDVERKAGKRRTGPAVPLYEV